MDHQIGKRFQYHQKSRIVPFVIIILFATTVSLVASSFDSPVNIQRQLQQSSQTGHPPVVNGSVNEPSSQIYLPTSPVRNARTSLPSINDNTATRGERVRRNEATRGSQASQQRQQTDECPPSRLVHSWLPSELVSTANQQRPKAYCDCTVDPFGWHVTCFLSPAVGPSPSSSADFQLPNQLHPAFRRPQLQRQQQQAAAAAAATAGSSNRRLQRRSPARWLDDELVSNETEDSETSSSVHEGFGEELVLTTPKFTDKQHKRAHGINSSSAADSLMPLSSSASFTLMQLDRQDLPADKQASSYASNRLLAPSNHLTFQSVPILFSIKYMRNNMIEIDCDQAAPHYKPAMFQGFSVNEIGSFSFNNCQLPNIPFSVLLHRTRALNNVHSPPANTNSTPYDQSAGSAARSGLQLLKPSRPKHQNLLRKRRAQLPTAEELEAKSGSSDTMDAESAAPARTGLRSEPRVRSLTINLNTVLDQRTLISLLTGLDLLEELQLNYMQLNLTNLEQDSGELADSASSLAGSSTELATNPSTAPPQPNAQNSTRPLPPATTQQAAPSGSSSATPLAGSRQTQPSRGILSATTAYPATTLPATATTTSTNIANQTLIGRAQTTRQKPAVSLLKPSSSLTRPSISMGAPRGLMVAQATTPANATSQTTTPLPASTTSSSASSVSPATTMINSQVNTLRTTISTQPIGANLNASVRNQPSQQPPVAPVSGPNIISVAQAHSVTYTSNPSVVPPIRFQTSQSSQVGPPPIVSSSSSVSSSVSSSSSSSSSSSNGGGVGGSGNGNGNGNSGGGSTSSSLLNSSQQLSSNRLHNSPSSWYQAPMFTTPALAAGSRLISEPLSTEQTASTPTSSSAQPSTSWTMQAGTMSGPVNTPYASSLASNAFGIRTPSSGQPLRESLAYYNNNGPSGFRTTTTNSQPTTNTNNQNIGMRNAQFTTMSTSTSLLPGQQLRRQQGPESTTQFVAAGVRLNQNQRQHQTISLPVASSPRSLDETLDDMEISATSNSVTEFSENDPSGSWPHTSSGRRVKRDTHMEPIELSFGEILPNLKSLKLESFVDLSQLTSGDKTESQPLKRFRRQFAPNDLPEHDEGFMNEAESEAVAADGVDPMIAEESRFHHNGFIMEPNATGSDAFASEEEPLSRSADPDWSLPGDEMSQDQSAPSSSNSRLRRFSAQLLTKMFSKLSKLRTLQLSSNDIPYWPDNVLFDSRHSLSRLYLVSNNIRLLSRSSLANMTHLETLDLSSNQLRQLNGDMFRDLSNLRNLRACRNLFRSLPGRLFAQINRDLHHKIGSNSSSLRSVHANRIENVDFSKNRYLSQLSADIFAPMSGVSRNHWAPITSLNLSDSSFDDQLAGKSPESLFASLPELANISLKGNRLKELLSIGGLFGKNNHLQRLDLSHNQLATLNANLFNSNASQIADLQLHHNQLTQIPEQFLFNLRKLRRLSVSHNKLTQLNAKLFFTNLLIEHIDLSHNQLITLNTQQSGLIPFGNGANLRHLNLGHNNLSQFESDIFDITWSFYTNLNMLDLSHNQFSGQIAMPIFYTITDELLLNLASNSIQSISVEALVQHEQILDRFASYEAEQLGAREGNSHKSTRKLKVPTVNIKLTGNPIACDCSLEPLISYSRRVAAATNPALVASIFAPKATSSDSEPPSSSRYSLLNSPNPSSQLSAQEQQQKQAQLFYQFKFNDLYCAKPASLERRLLTHISIGDLLCPIKDGRLCPSQCQCHYQSAFRTAIVDCNNRQLSQVPKQLTDAANFLRFSVESEFPLGPNNNMSRSVADVDKIIIRLDNNKLRSMSSLARLFTVISGSSLDGSERNRFARAPQRPNSSEAPLDEGTALLESKAASSSETPLAKKVMSPVSIARNLHTSSSGSKHRAQRHAHNYGVEPADLALHSANNIAMDSDVSFIPSEANSEPPTLPSTSVLESAEEFRNKRYPLTCELYLDHNLIDSIPSNFLEILDQVKSSAMESSQIPPQAALPTLMLEPPVHTKLTHLANGPDLELASTTSSSITELDSKEPRLFGRQPMAPEKKLALMETISQNVRINQQLQHHQEQKAKLEDKVSVSPSLVVLSLRYNNLSNIGANMLQRLSKLIKSSNTKLYLSHNPFNCTDNYAIPVEPSAGGEKIDMLVSPLGDQIMATSDLSSGAYLESTPGDLLPSASFPDGSVLAADGLNPIVPADCPIGQLKSWLTRHYSSIGDLDELYCVHMTQELAEKLRLTGGNSSSSSASERLEHESQNSRWDHHHPWASSLAFSPLGNPQNGSLVSKNGLTWNSEVLSATAKLIDLNLYDLCPYSGIQVLDPEASGYVSATHHRLLISVAVLFILISLCLLVMLVYFGDTQTILAFVYIHLNPLYSCLHLNESHLDGDKLYDAFVSYSSADRDIVMELIEKLEQESNVNSSQSGKMTDKPHDALVTDADLNKNPSAQGNGGDSTLNRRTNSFQDLSTMSRSSSRITFGGDQFSGSNVDLKPPNKENKHNSPYRLCIHERDWLPGHLISWNIVNSVQNSRRTILVLSKDFIKSVWFQVEFHTAYYQMLEDKIDRLIVIVRGELPPKNELDKNLAFLLTTKTYLTWGEKWFWERLHYALPHKAAPAALIKSKAKPKQVSKQHHHHYIPKPLSKQTESSELTGSSKKQKPLVMSSIGKDCSNLLLPVHHSNPNQPPTMIGSSSSNGSTSSQTRSSNSSFLSGSSTGDLLSPAGTTRVQIGAESTPTLSSTFIDSGRVTAHSGSSGSPKQVTRIVLDRHDSSTGVPNGSKIRAKKQERLQSFVDKNISNHFNLSEL